MLAAAIAASASAALPLSRSQAKPVRKAATERFSPLTGNRHIQLTEATMTMAASGETKTRAMQTRVGGAKLQRIAKAPRKTDGSGSKYDGIYTLTAGEWYFEDQAQASVPVEVELTVTDGVAVMTNNDYLVSDIMALLDEETGEMTFVNYYVGATSSYAVSVMPFIWNDDIDFSSYTITFNEASQSFDIPADHGISWAAYDLDNIDFAKAFNSDSIIGYYDIFDIEGLVKNSEDEDPELPENWKSIGTGTWNDGFLTDESYTIHLTDGVDNSWTVNIEESVITPGRYRILPYNDGSTPAEWYGQVDTNNYVYINAANPDSVYIENTWTPFGEFKFYQNCPEANKDFDPEEGEAAYGKLIEGEIFFPIGSFLEVYNDNLYYANADGFLQITLPGVTPKVYTLRANIDLCGGNGKTDMTYTAGADIAYLLTFTANGYYESADEMNTEGIRIAADSAVVPQVENKIGINTTFVRGYDANGNVRREYRICHFNNFDVDGWKTVDNKVARFTDEIFSEDAEEVTCPLEESVKTPGLYRLVNPYKDHEFALGHEKDHNHYLYLDATDPECVMLLPSAPGIGDEEEENSACWMTDYGYYFGIYMEMGTEVLKYFGLNGIYDTETGEIEIPYVMISITDLYKGSLLDAGPMHILIADGGDGGISEITSDNEADAVYYNIHGQRIARPTSPGVYIRNNTKVYVK